MVFESSGGEVRSNRPTSSIAQGEKKALWHWQSTHARCEVWGVLCKPNGLDISLLTRMIWMWSGRYWKEKRIESSSFGEAFGLKATIGRQNYTGGWRVSRSVEREFDMWSGERLFLSFYFLAEFRHNLECLLERRGEYHGVCHMTREEYMVPSQALKWSTLMYPVRVVATSRTD